MQPFAFHPELFEFRNRVLEKLAEHGYEWLSAFGSVDLAHDIYGMEVCGIREQSAALAIQKLLRRMFPFWRHTRIYLKEPWTREPGWVVVISRQREDHDDKWKSVGS
jgi:hypothetical protein